METIIPEIDEVVNFYSPELMEKMARGNQSLLVWDMREVSTGERAEEDIYRLFTKTYGFEIASLRSQ